MRTASVVAFLLLLASPVLAQGDPEKVHVRMHKKIAPSVVYVQGGGQTGSGVCVDKDGYILTSPTACGTSTDTVTVLAPGARSYQGKVVGRNNDKELVIVKIDATIPAVEFADSDRAKAGQVSYVFGDSYGSIVTDDQVAISLGVVSGIYELPKRNQRGTHYTGKVIETSAAVNPNQDGGPLVDGDGRLLGIVTLNYDESKFTGVAIPINAIKDEVLNLIKTHKGGGAAATTTTPPAKAPGYLGAQVEEVDDVGGLKVKRVTKNSPAEKAGLKAGDVIVKIDTRRVLTTKGFNETLGKYESGATVKLRVERDGKEQDVTVTLGKRSEY
jgi:S1-C subfamily serine protease